MRVLRRPPPSSSALKWLGLVAAVWVQAISGNNYTFSNYSPALKTLMNLTQRQLNNLSVAKDVGKAFGLLAGLASDRLPTWMILLIGSGEGLLGYGVQWLVVSQKIKPLRYWQHDVDEHRGAGDLHKKLPEKQRPCFRILKGYVGLSTAIFTDLCSALFSSSPSSFLAMLALIPFAVCLVAILFLREIPSADSDSEAEREESRYFWILNAVSVGVALCLLGFDSIPSPSVTVSRVFSVVLLALVGSPLAIPFHSFLRSRWPNEGQSGSVAEPLLAEEKGNKPAIGEDHTTVEAVKRTEFWILFGSFLCGAGTGLAVMNNMGQIGVAMGYSYDDVSTFISLMSICGFFGRILSGSASEHFIRKVGMPRPLWNAASQILMAVGYILLAIAMPGSLYIGSVIIGLCYGIRLAITVPTASEVFGLKNYGMIYNILILNLPLGSFLFSGLLAGILYDMEATATAGGGNTCVGGHCYRLVFVVMAASCVVGLAMDLILSYRTKRLYSKMKAAKR